MMKIKQLLVTFLVFASATFSSAANAAFDIYLFSNQFPKPAQSVDPSRSEKIYELLSFELGAETNIDIGSISGGGGAGKATFKEFTVTKAPDELTTVFLEHLAKGLFFDEMSLEVGNLKYDFRLIFVQDYATSGSDGDDIPEETWVLKFGEMKVTRTVLDKKGTPSDKDEFCWSVVTNSDC